MAIRTIEDGAALSRPDPQVCTPETVAVETLKAHPRNYRRHPEDQLAHICESIQRNGLYRNVVIARDNVILAGHGVVLAARKLGIAAVPVVRLDIAHDSPAALKLLTGDNEVANLGEIDDRLLSEILKEVKDADPLGLIGTGFDEKMLANLVFVTRPESELASMNDAAEWAGLPEFTPQPEKPALSIQCDTEEARAEAMDKLGIKTVHKRLGQVLSCWYPDRPREDLKNVEFK